MIKCENIRNDVNMILNRRIIDTYLNRHLVDFNEYANKERIILKLIKDWALHYKNLGVVYNEKRYYDQAVNDIILRLLLLDKMPINYCATEDEQICDDRHTPLSAALTYGFYDITKAMAKRDDLNINAEYIKGPSELYPSVTAVIDNYNDNMLVKGAYKAVFEVDSLKLNEAKWHSIYYNMLKKLNVNRPESIQAMMDFSKMLIEKDKLKSSSIDLVQKEINNLEERNNTLILHKKSSRK